MTNPSIPPCPVCGVVADIVSTINGLHVATNCKHLHASVCLPESKWLESCDRALGRALSTNGIHTLAELDKRLAPDPRVAVLVDAINESMNINRADLGPLSAPTMRIILRQALEKIAAQRGKVEV